MINSRKRFDWKDHDINQAYLKFLGKYGFVFIDFKGRIRRFPNKNDNMNGNATDLSGTNASPEAKANSRGWGYTITSITSCSGGKPVSIAKSPRSATFPFTNGERKERDRCFRRLGTGIE